MREMSRSAPARGTTGCRPEFKSERTESLMTDVSHGAFDRRGFIRLAAAGAGLAGCLAAPVAQLSATTAGMRRQPSPRFGDDLTEPACLRPWHRTFPLRSRHGSPIRAVNRSRWWTAAALPADLALIDFVAFAAACEADGFRCTRPKEVHSALTSANPRWSSGELKA